jgi:hypothetical protein
VSPLPALKCALIRMGESCAPRACGWSVGLGSVHPITKHITRRHQAARCVTTARSSQCRALKWPSRGGGSPRSCPSVEAAQKWSTVLQEQCRKAQRRKAKAASTTALPSTPAAHLPHVGVTAETPHTPCESVLSMAESLVAPHSERWQAQATEHLVAWLLPLHSSDVIKCGWLLKWRDVFPNRKWQRRLFVLRSDLTVRYYAEQKMGTIEERGQFDVRFGPADAKPPRSCSFARRESRFLAFFGIPATARTGAQG